MQAKYDSGRTRLLELGIRQALQRPLHWTHSSAVCFCIMSPLTGITGLYQTGLLYGGPAVLIWGWVLTSIVTFAIGLAMSELSSAYPVSGGLYFWSFMLARQYGPVASWVVGYFNLLGQIALVAADVYSCVSLFTALLFLATDPGNAEGYVPGVGMLYMFGGLLSLMAVINSMPLKIVGKIACVGAAWHIIGTIVVSVTLLCITDKQRPISWVLTHYENLSDSGITSDAYISLLGLLTACWSLIGYDAAAHLTEETRSADQTAGWPMIYAIGASFVTGLIYLIVLTVCLQDIADLTNANSALAGVNMVSRIFNNAWQRKFGAGGYGGLVLWVITLGANWFSALHSITSASRMLYGFSRDRAVPFWFLWQSVDTINGTPVCAVWGISFAAFLLGLPLLKGPVAFAATTSIACAGLVLSYAMPILLRLVFARRMEEVGPFSLGRWGVPVACIACIWALFSAVMFMMPTIYPITSTTLNYAPPAVGGALLVIMIAWFLSARHWFHGPRTDVDNSDAVRIRYWITDPPRVCSQ